MFGLVLGWAVAGMAVPTHAQPDPELAPNPAVIETLASLPPGQAVLLGEARVTGEFNDTAREHRLDVTGPRSRDYCLKMVWAPDRGRVLFCGANHGVPHRLNDVWEFDLAALTWVMLYAPDHNRSYLGLGDDPSDVVFRDGVLKTERGGPAVVGHTWWGLAYDTERRRLQFMNTWVTNQPEVVAELGGDPDQLDPGPPLWEFDPATRQWHHHLVDEPFPRAPFGGMLEYLPELGGTLWHTNNWQMRQSWLFEADPPRWRDLGANARPADVNDGSARAEEQAGDFESQAPEPEQIAWHDPGRGLLVAHRHWSTHHYDIAANRWQLVREGREDDGVTPWGHDARSVVMHDPESGLGWLLEFETNRLWAYDPDQVEWRAWQPAGDAMPDGRKRLAYFDPAHGVIVVIDGTTVWACRPPEGVE